MAGIRTCDRESQVQRGCSSKPRCGFIVTRGWQQMMNAIRWIKQFAKKTGKVCRAYLKETEAQHTATPPRHCCISCLLTVS